MAISDFSALIADQYICSLTAHTETAGVFHPRSEGECVHSHVQIGVIDEASAGFNLFSLQRGVVDVADQEFPPHVDLSIFGMLLEECLPLAVHPPEQILIRPEVVVQLVEEEVVTFHAEKITELLDDHGWVLLRAPI